MLEEYIKNIRGEEVERSLATHGSWVVANLNQSIGWPQESIIIKYEAQDIHLITHDDHKRYPAVAIRRNNGLSKENAQKVIYRFLSALNWVSEGSIDIAHWSGGSLPYRFSDNHQLKFTAQHFRITYLPANLSDEQQLALALLREGDSLRKSNYGYSFLSYYKIINLVKSNAEKQKKWIKGNCAKVLDSNGKRRMDELVAAGEAIEDYLYHSCRCALAHAGVDPTANPDDIDDHTRFYKDLPLICSLAKIAVEENFKIPSMTTVYKNHFYELSGFRSLLAEDFLKKIFTQNAVSRRELTLDFDIAIRQWCDKKYGVFERLRPKTRAIRDGIAYLECESPDGTFSINLVLGFRNERFELDIEHPRIHSASEATTISHLIDCKTFLRDLICNGEIELFMSNDERFLGRKDPNMPVNIDIGGTVEAFDNEIDMLRERLNGIA